MGPSSSEGLGRDPERTYPQRSLWPSEALPTDLRWADSGMPILGGRVLGQSHQRDGRAQAPL